MNPLFILIPAFMLTLGCSTQSGIKDFTSDGCSLFPDGNLVLEQDWCECCLAHDIAYWKGGTEEERLSADEALRDCILERTGNELMAEAVFQGVRFGGSPYFYNWYRWGYGWPYERKYESLSPKEKIAAQKKLDRFFAEHGTSPCE